MVFSNQQTDVEVEVSLDSQDNMYSIVVSEGSKLQSVVSVPSSSTRGRRRRRFRSLAKKNSSEELTASMAAHTRLVDELRPLSPNMSDRHSALEDSPRGRRRDVHSCPPAHNRPPCPDDGSQSRRGSMSARQQSCPPTQRDNSNISGMEGPVTSKVKTARRSSNKKPNLVSKTAARNRLFGSMKTRKISPSGVL